ncbi:MAG: hypothetical protein ACK5MY_10145 [Jhaorihella sp.]
MTKNWTAIKGALSEFSRVQLLGLVQDLYRADPRNQEFLHARFLVSGEETDIAPYKKRIKAAINPSRWDAPIKYRDARRAISDYNKARGQLDETLELMFYYVQCGNDVTLEFGDMDEAFYNSMGSMFGSIVGKITAQADPKLTANWLKRLETEYQRVSDTGWGYGDELSDYLEDLRAAQN